LPGVGNLDQSDPVAPNRQRQPAVLQRERVLAKDLIAPSGERRYSRLVVHGNRFEILSRSHQLLRNLMRFTALLQQDAQQLDQRAQAGRGVGSRRGRRLQRLRIGEAAPHRVEDLAAQLAFGEAWASLATTVS